jgi:hypothetical protein
MLDTRTTDEWLSTIIAMTHYESVRSDPDWFDRQMLATLGPTLWVFERLGLAKLERNKEDGQLIWRAANELIRLAERNGFPPPCRSTTQIVADETNC